MAIHDIELIVFLGSVQLICLGILGAYLGRIYGEVRRRPLYVVSESLEAEAGAGAQVRDRWRQWQRPQRMRKDEQKWQLRHNPPQVTEETTRPTM